MLLLLLQLPPAGPAAPGRAGCRATPAGPCGRGLPEALLRPLRGHLQGKFIKVGQADTDTHKPVNEGEAPIGSPCMLGVKKTSDMKQPGL